MTGWISTSGSSRQLSKNVNVTCAESLLYRQMNCAYLSVRDLAMMREARIHTASAEVKPPFSGTDRCWAFRTSLASRAVY
jgi:hypothetical protein